MHRGHDLTEEMTGRGLPEPPPSPDVGVKISMARGKHQVDVLISDHHLLDQTRGVNEYDN